MHLAGAERSKVEASSLARLGDLSNVAIPGSLRGGDAAESPLEKGSGFLSKRWRWKWLKAGAESLANVVGCILATARLFLLQKGNFVEVSFITVPFITVDGEGLVIFILVLDRADLEKRVVSLPRWYTSPPVDLPSLVNLI